MVEVKTAVQDISECMHSMETDPLLRTTMTQGLSDWLKGDSLSACPIHNPSFQSAFSEQNKIHWYNLLLGIASKKWVTMQDRYLRRKKSQRSGKRWLMQILKKLMEVA